MRDFAPRNRSSLSARVALCTLRHQPSRGLALLHQPADTARRAHAQAPSNPRAPLWEHTTGELSHVCAIQNLVDDGQNAICGEFDALFWIVCSSRIWTWNCGGSERNKRRTTRTAVCSSGYLQRYILRELLMRTHRRIPREHSGGTGSAAGAWRFASAPIS
jgi:hypothetical protein